MLTSNDKGNIAELAIALEATKLGIEVLKPVSEHVRYDLAFDLGHRILRVQCKWARFKGRLWPSTWPGTGSRVAGQSEPSTARTRLMLSPLTATN